MEWRGTELNSLTDLSGVDLHAVFAFSADDVWAVGDRGTVLHYDGNAVTQTPAPATADLRAVWSPYRGNVWVGGNGVLASWDGSEWRRFQTSHNILAMGGRSEADVWALSETAVVRFNGTEWSSVKNVVGAKDMWVAPQDDVYVLVDGWTHHWKDNRWRTFANGEAPLLERLSGNTAGEIRGTESGAVFRLAGESWVRITERNAEPLLRDLVTLWVDDRGPTYIAGRAGTLARVADGNHEILAGPSRMEHLYAVSGSAPDDVWMAGRNGVILHWDGTAVSVHAEGRNGGTAYYDAWMVGRDDGWLVGERGTALHWNGHGWLTTETGTGVNLFGVWAADANHVWAVGDGRGSWPGYGVIRFWDGQRWHREMDGVSGFVGVSGTSGDDVWACTVDGVVYRRQGGEWQELPERHGIATAIWARSPDDVWLAGQSLERWNGIEWQPIDIPELADERAQLLTGAASNGVWAVTPTGTAFHHDGASWRRLSLPARTRMWDLSSPAAGGVWGVGEDGAVLWRDVETK
ncbi:MAG: hypothetical protein AB2A00_10005 [Myxococcota bacterium]